MPLIFSTGLILEKGGKNWILIMARQISREDFDRLALKIKPEKGDIIFPRYEQFEGIS